MRLVFSLFMVLFAVIPNLVRGQELRCHVSVSAPKIQGTNRELYSNMQRDIYEFMNNRRWSGHFFAEEERIECSLLFTIEEQSGSDRFRGSLQIKISRPVYNSSYQTVLLNLKDQDIDFIYHEFEALEYNENGQNSSLVYLLAFYANIILGLDYDSFSLMGGNEFYDKAENIVARCQNAQETGWKSYEDRKNRYWLIHHLQDRSFSAVRECIYQYHRLGLDAMSGEVNDGKSAISEALELLQKVHKAKPNTYLMQVFFDAKSDEIVQIFQSAFADERRRIYNIVSGVNQANIAKYAVLIREKKND